MTWAATLPTICAACREAGTLEVTQLLERGALSWREQFACACGHGFSVENPGLPLPAARKALMAKHGRFELIVEVMPEQSKAWAVLMRLLECDEAQVRAALGTLPSTIWQGTPAETDFVRQALTRGGATVRVSQ